MKEIKINDTLLQRLKTDYNEASDQVKFMNGLDYLEAMVKLFAVINIAVVKEIDEDVYKKIFLANFKNSPSLGDYKSLATKLFLKKDDRIDKDLMIYDSLKNKDPFYDVLYKLFTEKIKFEKTLELDNILKLIEEGKSVKLTKNDNKPTNLQTLFDNYIVTFRNKLKGHGASFNGEDKEQSQIILKNLDIIITTIELKIETLFSNSKLSFFIQDDENSSKNHEALKVFAQYDKVIYQLSPLIIYHKCNKFSCQDDHKVKLFFYNDGKASKSYYIDYSFNHYYYFSSNNEVDNTLKELVTQQKEINAHATSDDQRQSGLLSVFVGREKELKASQEHIIKNIESNTPSAITIKGKPGIGKSAFISKLQEELTKKVEELQTYIFYARKSEMGDEHKNFFDDWNGYLGNIEIKISMPKQKNGERLSTRKKLEYVFEVLNKKLKKPMLLIIDGLDEFTDPDSFLKSFPMQNVPKKLHFVFSTRGYSYILDTLQTKLFNSQLDILHKESYMAESVSITLGKLSAYEVEALLSEVLTKDIRKDDYKYKTNIYETIQEEIYEKSEGLPLYINYISNKLIELDLKSSNIGNEILKYTKELPQGLDDFYFQSLGNIEPESSQILYTLYFAHKHITFDSFHHLFKQLTESTIDKRKFQKKYFNDIEIFLSKDLEDKYGFYHLSVKEAIKRYFMQDDDLESIVEIDYEKFKENVPISVYQEKQYKEIFSQYYYLKEDSDLFKFLEGSVSKVDNNGYLKEFYEDNYLTYFYKYINFCNYHEILTFKEIVDKNYTKFENTTLSPKTIKQIKEFFEIYDLSKKQDLSEIKYAHSFALLVKDYSKVITYAKDYRNAFFNLFIDIVLNLDEPKNQKLFKELKPIWSELHDGFQLILLNYPKIFHYIDINEVGEILNSIAIDSSVKEELADIIVRQNTFDQALEIISFIDNEQSRLLLLKSIVEKINDQKFLAKALKIFNSIESPDERSKALTFVVNKTDNVQEALKISNTIENPDERSKALTFVVNKTDNVLEALKISNTIENPDERSKALTFVVNKTDNVQEALKISNTIENPDERSKAISSIANIIIENANKMSKVLLSTTVSNNYNNLLEKAVEYMLSIEDNQDTQSMLKSFLEFIDELNTLEIDHNINLTNIRKLTNNSIAKFERMKNKVDELDVTVNSLKAKREVFISLLFKIYNNYANEVFDVPEETIARTLSTLIIQASIYKVLKIARGTSAEKEVIVFALIKLKSIDTALEFTLSEEDIEKSRLLKFILPKINDINYTLEIISLIDAKDTNKSVLLKSIVARTNNQDLLEKAFKTADSIDDIMERSTVKTIIIKKIDDIDKALNMIISIENTWKRSEAKVSIVKKIDDIEKDFVIIDSIENSFQKSIALSYIMEKCTDENVFKKIIEIFNSINNSRSKEKILISIIERTEDTALLRDILKITSSINNSRSKEEVLISIIKRTEDTALLSDILETINTINDWESKIQILSFIVTQTEDTALLRDILKITSSMNNSRSKEEVLISIIKRTEDTALLRSILEITNTINDWESKIQILSFIITQTEDKELLDNILKIISTINDLEQKIAVFTSIIAKTDGNNLLGKIMDITDSFENKGKESKELKFIFSHEYVDPEKFKIQKDIYLREYKSLKVPMILSFIVAKTNNQNLLHEAIKIANTIENDYERSDILVSIAVKMNDQVLLVKAIKIANTIENDWRRAKLLITAIPILDDPNLLKNSLEFSTVMDDSNMKVNLIKSVVQKTDEQDLLDRALEIVNSIENDWHKVQLSIAIIEKISDIEKVLEIANSFKENWYKSQLLLPLIEKLNDIDRALEITTLIEDDFNRSEALVSIVEKTNDQNLLKRAQVIANSIQNDKQREKVFIHIKKKNNTLSSLDNYLYKFNAVLNFNIYKSMEYVALDNRDAILRYYGILNSKNNELESFIEKLHHIKMQRDRSEESNNERLYEKLTLDAINLKEIILEDESMLKEILQQYDVSRLALKKKDILDII